VSNVRVDTTPFAWSSRTAAVSANAGSRVEPGAKGRRQGMVERRNTPWIATLRGDLDNVARLHLREEERLTESGPREPPLPVCSQ